MIGREIRELRNFAFAAVLGQPGAALSSTRAGDGDLKSRVAAFEAAAITEALHKAHVNVGEALRLLGLPRKTFYDKVARLDLNLPDLRLAGKRDGRPGS